MNKKQITTIILFIIISIIYIFIWWYTWFIGFVLWLAFYSIIFYLFYSTFKLFKNKDYKIFNLINYKLFLDYFLFRVLILISSLIIFIWWFAYYHNDINPAKMPTYTLTNWEKTLVFQAMSHIWSENYYLYVRDLIEYKKNKDYVLFFEWVRPWSEENHKEFNKAIWINFDEKTYDYLSQLYWLVAQDNNLFLWLVNDLDYNVDVDMDFIMQEYFKKKSNSQTVSNKDITKTKSPINIWEDIMPILESLNWNALRLFQYINRAMINIIIKNEQLQNMIKSSSWASNIFDVILDKRDYYIANEIINSDYDKIIATYWLLHFEWIFNILKQNDPNWRIVEIYNTYPLR